eukprot:365480-Chlamydomonas_euryale.AAC.18
MVRTAHLLDACLRAGGAHRPDGRGIRQQPHHYQRVRHCRGARGQEGPGHAAPARHVLGSHPRLSSPLVPVVRWQNSLCLLGMRAANHSP